MPLDCFEDKSYAYLHADRPVRRKGELITPVPLTQISLNGTMTFKVLPNNMIDNAEDFTYHVAAFGADGRKIFSESIVMPERDAELWDLVPESVDLDACTITE